MSELLKLAERCEAATGPDRGIDYTLACWFSRRANVPAYTASLDAAMTLMPRGLSLTLYVHPDETHADIFQLHPSKGMVGEAEQAKSPALALCAASLRALVSLQARGDQA